MTSVFDCSDKIWYIVGSCLQLDKILRSLIGYTTPPHPLSPFLLPPPPIVKYSVLPLPKICCQTILTILISYTTPNLLPLAPLHLFLLSSNITHCFSKYIINFDLFLHCICWLMISGIVIRFFNVKYAVSCLTHLWIKFNVLSNNISYIECHGDQTQ